MTVMLAAIMGPVIYNGVGVVLFVFLAWYGPRQMPRDRKFARIMTALACLIVAGICALDLIAALTDGVSGGAGGA